MKKVNKKYLRSIIKHLIVFSLGVFIICDFYHYNFLVTLLLLIGFIGSIKIWFKEKKDRLFFVIATVFGTIAELFGTYFKVWTYSNPSFLNIPMWLPLAWGMIVLWINSLVKVIERMVRERGR